MIFFIIPRMMKTEISYVTKFFVRYSYLSEICGGYVGTYIIIGHKNSLLSVALWDEEEYLEQTFHFCFMFLVMCPSYFATTLVE